jgi:hypothetical protein
LQALKRYKSGASILRRVYRLAGWLRRLRWLPVKVIKSAGGELL